MLNYLQTFISIDDFNDIERAYINAVLANPSANRKQIALGLGATEGQLNYWYSAKSKVNQYINQELSATYEYLVETQIRAVYKAILSLEESLDSEDENIRFNAAKELAKLSPSLTKTLAKQRVKDVTSNDSDKLITLLQQK